MFAVESVTRPFLFGWRRSSLPPFSPIQLPIERVEEVNDEKSPANSASAKSPALLSPTQYHRPPVWQTANPHVLYRCLLTLLGFAGAVVLLGGVGFIVSNLLVQQSYDHNDVQARVEHGLLQLQKKRGSRSSWAHRISQIGEPWSVKDSDPSWSSRNTDWRRELWMHDSAGNFIEEAYRDIPDLLHLWRHVQLPVFRAELFRDSILYLQGGVYADIDTECIKPINEWLTAEQWADPSLHSVVGIEIDEPTFSPDRWRAWHWPHPFQLSNFVMMTKQWSPVPRRSLAIKAKRVFDKAAAQKVEVDGIDWQLKNQSHLSYACGTAAWTDAILEVMNEDLEQNLTQIERWNTFTRTERPVQVGGVLVQPINAFAAGQAHSGSTPRDEAKGQALINHRWTGTWVDWSRSRRLGRRHTDKEEYEQQT